MTKEYIDNLINILNLVLAKDWESHSLGVFYLLEDQYLLDLVGLYAGVPDIDVFREDIKKYYKDGCKASNKLESLFTWVQLANSVQYTLYRLNKKLEIDKCILEKTTQFPKEQ